MAEVEKYEVLVLGSGEAGKWTAWTMADEGHRTAMVERKWPRRFMPEYRVPAQ
jgi:pyruvate/2-oxoglutarate dehydrogenase complex dihydrolipoamide dehydrogenase (E3) component